jgi:23S rRNA pseudoU1915 N3-methylase RlmH
MILFQAIWNSANAQTSSESAATTTNKPSDTEIKKTLDRALDKVEDQQKALTAKDEVIQSQDEALAEAEKGKEQRKAEAEALRRALESQTKATEMALEGWKRDEARVKELENKLRKRGGTTTRFAIIAGIAAGVTLLLLK